MTETTFYLKLSELCQVERIEQDTISEIVEYGIVSPVEGEKISEWVFDITSVHWIKKAVRLHQDLEIDWIAVSLVIELLQQKESLEKENEYYQLQLRRFIQKT